VCPEDQLSLKICQNCNNQIEDVYPIYDFCHNTTNIMSVITGSISLDAIEVKIIQKHIFFYQYDLLGWL